MHWPTYRAVLFLLGTLVLMLVALPPGQPAHAMPLPLFQDVPAPPGMGVSRAMAARAVARHTRYVELDLTALGDTRTTLNLFPAKLGGTLTAVWDRAEETSPDRWAWIGVVDGVDDSEVTIVVDLATGIAAGSVVMPGASYRIRYAGQGVHVVEEVDSRAFPGDAVRRQPGRSGDVAAAESLSADAPVTLDVLVLYTPAARVAAGGGIAIRTLIDLAATETNQGYANSGVYHRIRVVHKAELSYSERTIDPFGHALEHVTDSAAVASLRATTGADLVVLLIDDPELCGLAWLFNGLPSSAFSVTAWDCATGVYSFGHEVGHNLGAEHDWGAPDAVEFAVASSNHGYIAPDSSWRTIMAYSDACELTAPCTIINRWSNPALSHGGIRTGIAAGQPQAADNRKALNARAPTVATYKASVACTGQPTISPTSRTASAAGGTASVSVTSLAGCTWGATSNVSWIKITAGATVSGNGTVTYRVAANGGGSRSGTLRIAGRTFTVNQAGGTCGTASAPCALTSGTAKTGISGAAGSKRYYKISVPANVTKLVVVTAAGSGNVDLYVARGSVPSLSTYTCRRNSADTTETCTILSPQSGTWYVMLYGAASYSNVTVKATLTKCNPNTAPGCPLRDGIGLTPLSGAEASSRYYYIDVPAGHPTLAVTTTGGIGDVDLYVRFGGTVSRSTYDCESAHFTSTESCSRANPAAGRYYILLFGFGSYSGVTLSGNY